jgi:hypothetical protein
VPLTALEEGGVPPEVGDKVSASFDATVKSVSGGTATLEIDSINGEPVSEEASETPEEEQGEEGEESTPPSGAGGGPSGPASGADGLGRPLGAAPLRPANRTMTSKGMPNLPGMPRTSGVPIGGMMTPTGETTAQMGRRLRKGAALGRALSGY